jgi:hypothetical protein
MHWLAEFPMCICCSWFQWSLLHKIFEVNRHFVALAGAIRGNVEMKRFKQPLAKRMAAWCSFNFATDRSKRDENADTIEDY